MTWTSGSEKCVRLSFQCIGRMRVGRRRGGRGRREGKERGEGDRGERGEREGGGEREG